MSAPLTRPRAVLFDWDNTLVTNWRCVHAATNAALVAFGKRPWTLEESYERIRQSLRDSFPTLFGDDWMKARDIFYAHFEAHHLDYLDVLPGAADLLEALAGQGVYLGVVSNKTGRFLRAEAKLLGWDRHFGALVGATDAPADKPAAAPVTLALAPSGIEPGPDVWFIGDADVDMECAHRTGCLPILIGATPAGGDGLERWPPAYRFDDCLALSALVRGL
ncbi:MAG TPA: HAD family hydrolase [Azospirillaceae bacterium]|nr:HAD family hydrolase [Azospirillaceae bacterium]